MRPESRLPPPLRPIMQGPGVFIGLVPRSTMYRSCPKCAHYHKQVVPQCATCGLVFAKWDAHQRTLCDIGPEAARDFLASAKTHIPNRWLDAEASASPIEILLKAALWGTLVLWSLWFITTDYKTLHQGLPEINHSIMHLINLVFHEAGHLIFMLFGRFLMVLGGSFLQLLIPALLTYSLLVRQQDPFGASVTTWWFSQSVMDLAPYVYDARSQQMALLGGGTGSTRPGSHDWHYLLNQLGLLDSYAGVAACIHILSILLMIGTLIWGALILHNQWRVRGRIMDLQSH